MSAALSRLNRPRRRGVTLVEMLVVVALVILMMTILVQIFANATGAMTASKAIQELDVQLRQADLRLKQDLLGVTARLTPPLDPALKLGYFEYGENAFADAQGEDSDDYLAFTTKAPEGQVFTGRVYIPNNANNVAGNTAVQPVTVTSQLAEVIYFLRNGNLYRRVLLIAPQRQGSLVTSTVNRFPALAPSAATGWLGVNDISARPSSTGSIDTPIPNDLGTLTNRENRAFRPRLRTDFFSQNANGTLTAGADGIDDDANGDDIPDFYPTLYPNLFAATNNPNLVNEAYLNKSATRAISTYDVLPFPYIYPGMYTQPVTASLGLGWVHSLDPSLNSFNHNPLFSGDNQAVPNVTIAGSTQTWLGFPTWRETLSTTWHDPVVGPTYGFAVTQPVQQNGLRPWPPTATPGKTAATAGYGNNLLPTVNNQYGNDGVGSSAFAAFSNPDINAANYSSLAPANAQGVWDDDLLLTNVRSFDIKAFDPYAPNYQIGAAAGYYDLGYAIQANVAYATTTPTFLWDSTNQPVGFGHAGRIPPLGGPLTVATGAGGDNRLNPAQPFNPFAPSPTFYNGIGDNGTDGKGAGVIRLNRVFDTWSTDYSNAPAYDINLRGLPSNNSNVDTKNISYPGSPPSNLPIYPSYPAPYTSPLRGIQIQIRVGDARGEHIKVLTIRHDFTDKL